MRSFYDSLLETKAETMKYFNLSAKDLTKNYGVGKWSVKEILVHLADGEAILHERIKRVIAEPKPVIWAFSQDLWCINLNYKNFPLGLSKELYLSNRNSIIYLAEQYYEKYGLNEFVHSETGLRTLKDEFEKVASHNKTHLNQIKKSISLN